MMSVVDSGHSYDLHNLEGGAESVQRLTFIKKQPKEGGEEGELETVENGTTNEAVLQVLIHRMKVLDEKMPSDLNHQVIQNLETALLILEKRTMERKERGVEGTSKA